VAIFLPYPSLFIAYNNPAISQQIIYIMSKAQLNENNKQVKHVI
jgi:hypothetical protein